MAPNSEEGGRFGQYPFAEDSLDKVSLTRMPFISNMYSFHIRDTKWTIMKFNFPFYYPLLMLSLILCVQQ